MKPSIENQIHKNKISSYKKIICVFIACLLMVTAAAYAVNQISIQIVCDDLYESQRQNSAFFKNMLDNEFMRIYARQKEILESEPVQELIYAPADQPVSKRSDAVLQISNSVKSLVSYQFSIRESGLYIPSQNLVINNISFMSENDWGKLEQIQTIFHNASGYVSHTTNSEIVLFTPAPAYGAGEKKAAVYVILDSERLRQTLRSVNPQAVNILAENDFRALIYNGVPPDGLIPWLKENETGNDIYKTVIDGAPTWVVSAPLKPYGITLYSCVLEDEVIGNLKRLTALSAFLIVVCLLAMFLFIFATYKVIYRPISKLMEAFGQLDKGNLDVRIDVSRHDEFGYLYQYFNAMVENLKISFNHEFSQAIRLEKAELSQLYLQVQPHFLYNCLFNLSNLCIAGDYGKVRQFIRLLGNYYKYITYGTEKLVPFEEEYNYMLQYTEIQALRFGGRIRIETAPLYDWAKDIYVPKLVLQPVVENAYKYACELRLDEGLIRVGLERNGAFFMLTVEDNGEKLTEEALSALRLSLKTPAAAAKRDGGLANIDRRLKLHFTNKSGVEADRSPLGGLLVTIRIYQAEG